MRTERPSYFRDLAESLERKRARDWATNQSTNSLTGAEAANHVAQALRFARDAFSADFALTDIKLLQGILHYEKFFTSMPPTCREIEIALERSKTDYYCFQALRFVVTFFPSTDSQPLESWRKLLGAGYQKEPSRPRGVPKFRDAWRNYLIVGQIKQLEIVGFQPTQSPSTANLTSGCSIVVEALSLLGRHMSYDAVEAVWKQRDTLPRAKIVAEHLFGTVSCSTKTGH